MPTLGIGSRSAFLFFLAASIAHAVEPSPKVVLDEALQVARKITVARERQPQLASLAECYAQAGDTGAAFKLIDAISDNSKKMVIESVAEVQIERGEIPAALATIDKYFPLAVSDPAKHESIERVPTLAKIVVAQVKTGDVAAARKNFAVAKALCDAFQVSYEKNLKADLKLKEADAEIHGGSDLATSREALLRAQIALGMIAEARTASKELFADTEDHGATRFSELLAEGQKFAEAQQEAQSIADEYARILALGGIAEQQIQAKDTAGATKVLKLITDLTSGLRSVESADDEERASIVNRVLSQQAILEVRLGQFVAAHATCLRIGELSIRATALAELGKAQFRNKQAALARTSFDEAFNAALRVSDEPDGERLQGETLEQVALARAQAGDLEGARQVFHWLNEGDRKGVVARSICEALIEQKQFDAVPPLLAWIADPRERAETFHSLCRLYVKNERLAAALDLARSQKDPLLQSQALTGVAIGLLEQRGQYHPLKKPEDPEKLLDDPFGR